MSGTFFDSNVLLESLLPNRSKVQLAIKMLANTERVVISPLTAHIFVHFGKKEGFSVTELIDIFRGYDMAQLGPAELDWAITNRRDNDFEDALQVACAVLGDCKEFVTFDNQLARNYSQFIKITVPK